MQTTVFCVTWTSVHLEAARPKITQTDKQPSDICLCHTTAIWNNFPETVMIKQQSPSSKQLIVPLMLAGLLPSLPS